jgi:hypothetical protein
LRGFVTIEGHEYDRNLDGAVYELQVDIEDEKDVIAHTI